MLYLNIVEEDIDVPSKYFKKMVNLGKICKRPWEKVKIGSCVIL